MTIPAGPASLADIQTEFGGANPIGLDEYYQGAGTGFVTASNYTPAGGIPTSGPISIGNFLSKTKVTAFTFTETVSSNLADYNLRTRAMTPFVGSNGATAWDGTSVLNATVTINSGIYVYSTSTASAAFWLGSTPIPAGSTITVTNNGLIVGQGGVAGGGGIVNSANHVNGTNGLVGGPAFLATYPINVTNNGTIGGGGGGGGGGGSSYYNDGKSSYGSGGGGGGGGRARLTSGLGTGGFAAGHDYNASGVNGSNATLVAQGPGGAGGNLFGVVIGGAGGAGGALGQPGNPGALAGGTFTTRSSAGAGGGAGGAILGGSYISWYVFGTRFGTIDHPGNNLTGGTVALPGAGLMQVDGFYLSAAPRSVWINFYDDGTIRGFTHGNVLQWTYNWHTPTSVGIGSAYWIQATLASGLTPSSGPAMGVWTQLNTSPGWTYTSPGGFNSRGGSLTINISASSGGSVIATGTATFNVETEL